MSGLPGICKVTIGQETTFGSNSAAHRTLPAREYTRFNRSVAVIDDSAKIRCNIGPTAGVLGLDAVQDLAIKVWAQSGVTPITGTPGAWSGVKKEMYEGLPGVGSGNTSSTKGFSGTITSATVSDVTVLTLVGQAASIADYRVGSIILVTDSVTGVELAFIRAKLANTGTPADLDLTLDRELAGSDPTAITGAYCVPLDPQGGASAHGLITGDDHVSYSLEQTDMNGITDRALGACVSGYSLTTEASADGTSKLLEEWGFKLNSAAMTVAAASSPTAAPAYTPMTVHDYNVVINESVIENVISMAFSYECEVAPRMDVSASTGRSGMVVTKVTPKITITALRSTIWDATIRAAFDARTECKVSLAFSPNATPAAGDLMGVYASKCVISDPYQIEDQDTQVITLEMTCLYDAANAMSAVISVA